ncbi:MAG: hypothetical protein KDB71_13205 [Mycobacterium sp.]|nr:hypothetical protein [Mycobacterium sp.]
MKKTTSRAAAAAGSLAVAAAVAVGCSQTEDATKDLTSSAVSAGSSAASAIGSAASSAASAAGSAASSAASAAGSAASSAASVASGAASSALNGAPTTLNVPGLGEVAMDGPTAEAYRRLGGESVLGSPTAQAQKVGEGTVQPFTNGTIFSSPATGAHVVQGEILTAYQAQGGPEGRLGWPTADETETGGGPALANGGWVCEFQHGTITWLNDGNGNFNGTTTTK